MNTYCFYYNVDTVLLSGDLGWRRIFLWDRFEFRVHFNSIFEFWTGYNRLVQDSSSHSNTHYTLMEQSTLDVSNWSN